MCFDMHFTSFSIGDKLSPTENERRSYACFIGSNQTSSGIFEHYKRLVDYDVIIRQFVGLLRVAFFDTILNNKAH